MIFFILLAIFFLANAEIPKPQKIKLNGLTLYIYEEHSLPLINITALFPYGSNFESIKKIGISSILSQVWRTSGTKFFTSERFNEELEFLGAQLDISIGSEYSTLSMSFLSKDLDKGLELFYQIIRHPKFEKEKFILAKIKTIESIKRRNDNPWDISRREFYAAIYSKQHPYGWYPEIETINNIKFSDLEKIFKTFFLDKKIYIGLSGDINTEKIIQSIKEKFSDWKGLQPPDIKIPSATEKYTHSIRLFHKDLTQSYIRIGKFGIKRFSEDFFPILVFDNLLGSSFTSKLFTEIRSKKGLAYVVGSSFTEPVDYGVVSIVAQTRIDSTADVIQEIAKIINNHITEDEMNLSKEFLKNSFVFRFQTPHQIVTQNMILDFQNYPPDYLDNYLSNIENVKLSDLKKVAQKYYQFDKMLITIVSNKNNITLEALKNIKDFETIDLK